MFVLVIGDVVILMLIWKPKQRGQIDHAWLGKQRGQINYPL